VSTIVARTQRKVREARKTLASAHEQAPAELRPGLAEAVTAARRVEERTAQMLREGFQPRGAP
jgi:hypothetical protein